MALAQSVKILQNPVAQVRIFLGTFDCLLFGATGAIAAFLLGIASLIQVDYFDSYSILLNAKAIAFNGGRYDYHRFLFAPLIHIPGVMLSEWSRNPHLAVRISHFIGWGYFVGSLYAAFRLFRLQLPRTTSLLSVLIFSCIPLLIHYAPSAKEDVPALFFFLMALQSFWLNQKNRFPVLTSLWMALAVGHRYNLGPILILIFAIWDVAQIKTLGLRGFLWRQFTLILMTCFLISAVVLAVYPRIYAIPAGESLALFFRQLFVQYTHNQMGYLPPYMVAIFLVKLISLPLLGIALIGAIRGYTEKNTDLRFHILTFLVVFLVQLFLVPGKEARYLFVLLPSVALLATVGLSAIWQICRQNLFLFAPVVLILLLQPGLNTIRELRKFTDPFYRTPFAPTLSEKAGAMAAEKNGRLIWIGTYAAAFPKNAVFDFNDPFSYIYHTHIHTVYYYTNQIPLVMEGGTLVPRGNWEDGFELAGLRNELKPGDTLIINPAAHDISTRNLPDFLPPIVIQRVGEISAEGKAIFDKIETVWAKPELRTHEIHLGSKETTSNGS